MPRRNRHSGFYQLANTLAALGNMILTIRETQRRIELHESRLALDHERKLAELQTQRLNEVKIMQVSNLVVIGDLDIEKKKLEIQKLERELGVNQNPFEPPNYP